MMSDACAAPMWKAIEALNNAFDDMYNEEDYSDIVSGLETTIDYIKETLEVLKDEYMERFPRGSFS